MITTIFTFVATVCMIANYFRLRKRWVLALGLVVLWGGFFISKKQIRELRSSINELVKVSPKRLPTGMMSLGPMTMPSPDGLKYLEGLKKFDAKEYNTAYKIGKEIIAETPDIGLGYQLVGIVEARRQDDLKAAENLTKALQIGLPESDKAVTYYFLGVIDGRKGQLESAFQNFQKSLEFNADFKPSISAINKIEEIKKLRTVNHVN